MREKNPAFFLSDANLRPKGHPRKKRKGECLPFFPFFKNSTLIQVYSQFQARWGRLKVRFLIH